MLSIRDLSVCYGDKKILNKLNIDIPKGEIHALIGPSGCGKSTLLKSIAGINEICQGSIRLGEEDITPKSHVIGYIPQDYGLLKWKNVYENLIMGAIIKDRDYKSKVDQIVSELNLGNLLKSYPGELSGGEKQRVAIARALILAPDILLMDEPFSSLDDYTKDIATNLFLDVWKKHKVTSLIITHNHASAMYLGKNIIVMNKLGMIEDIKENKLFGISHTDDLETYRIMLDDLKSFRKERDNI